MGAGLLPRIVISAKSLTPAFADEVHRSAVTRYPQSFSDRFPDIRKNFLLLVSPKNTFPTMKCKCGKPAVIRLEPTSIHSKRSFLQATSKTDEVAGKERRRRMNDVQKKHSSHASSTSREV